jgi:amino acid transporter
VYASPLALAVLVGGFITWLNRRGVAGLARFQSALTFGKIAISLVFFALALTRGDVANLEPLWTAPGGSETWTGLWAVFATAPFFLAGFDVVPLAMGEKSVSTSKRAVYIAIIGSLVAAVAYYALVILAGAMLLPRPELLASELPAVAAFERAFDSPVLAKLVLVAGLMGVLTCWNSSVFAAGRVLYAMAESRMIPAWFGRLHPQFATPARAAVFATCAGLLLLPFGRSVIYPVVNASGSSVALVALIVCLGLLRLRLRSGGALDDPDRGRGRMVLLVAATAGAAFIVVMAFWEAWRSAKDNTVPLEWLIFLAWIVLGAAFWVSTRGSRSVISEDERRTRLLGTA